ncbi:hypothetical protein FQR65_LT01862 [Abscondita terminalis]|nr:hypothetical protein FQR65_LT01862 [Abscondita terminalis]
MNLIVVLFFIMAPFKNTKAEKDIYPPLSMRFKQQIYETDSYEEVTLTKDSSKGCSCRKYLKNWLVCTGNDSCQKFPTMVVNSTNLKIHTTSIEILYEDDFKYLKQLSSLNIEHNALLSVIEPGIFSNMSKLTNISISFNPNLKTFHERIFEGLINLKELLLVKNGFRFIMDVSVSLSPRFLPRIFKLSLNENLFREIGKDDFEPMTNSSLRELNLILCQIEYMHPECLVPLKNLAAIRLGENPLNSSTLTDVILNSTEHDVPLQFMNLYSLGFRKTPPRLLLKAISQSTITQLSLSRNQFEVLSNSTFPPMPTLKYLDLRETLIGSISSGAFAPLSNLRTLLLSGNKLSGLPDGVLLEELTYLDLSLNSRNPSMTGYFSLGKNKFVKMNKLKYLNLSYNRIQVIFNSTFNGLSKLRVLGMKNASIHRIFDYGFYALSNLLVLNLEKNQFGLSRHVFSGLDNLQVLLLGGCSFTHISYEENPLQNLSALAHLCLEDNNLMTLSPTLLKPLPNLVTLDISNNFIRSWSERLFAHNMKISIIFAAHNKISHLTTSMLNDFSNLTQLDISKNPLIYDCTHFSDLNKWLNCYENNSLINLIMTYPTLCTYPYEFNNDSFITAFESLSSGLEPCTSFNYKLYLMIVVPSVGFVVITVLCCLLAYCNRWNIRYWLFLARGHITSMPKRTKKLDLKSYTNYEYDAFVSYSNEDKNFVVRLVAMLENFEPFLRLCVYERDFEVGSVISDTVLASIEQSRKTILIISDAFARSEWCRWEVQIVQHHRLNFECLNKEVDDSLVMIKLGNLNMSNCTPTLKYLMRTRIYLEWDSDENKQPLFWERLRKILTPQTVIYDSCV